MAWVTRRLDFPQRLATASTRRGAIRGSASTSTAAPSATAAFGMPYPALVALILGDRMVPRVRNAWNPGAPSRPMPVNKTPTASPATTGRRCEKRRRPTADGHNLAGRGITEPTERAHNKVIDFAASRTVPAISVSSSRAVSTGRAEFWVSQVGHAGDELFIDMLDDDDRGGKVSRQSVQHERATAAGPPARGADHHEPLPRRRRRRGPRSPASPLLPR